eukprot:TRINITY_DN18127_c0_g1_i1.p1 TRINITY_DN18127_c0_g1~~TRINITY_DN18127_c0_g1_i1.p1  ORF type:complete len:413 (+),score=90.63 TRINITY_DN18127_c0_g1_i1:127-1365(+)
MSSSSDALSRLKKIASDLLAETEEFKKQGVLHHYESPVGRVEDDLAFLTHAALQLIAPKTESDASNSTVKSEVIFKRKLQESRSIRGKSKMVRIMRNSSLQFGDDDAVKLTQTDHFELKNGHVFLRTGNDTRSLSIKDGESREEFTEALCVSMFGSAAKGGAEKIGACLKIRERCRQALSIEEYESGLRMDSLLTVPRCFCGRQTASSEQGSEATQILKDLKRDSVIVNGEYLDGSASIGQIIGGFGRVVMNYLPRDVLNRQALALKIVGAVLGPCNRTNSAGDSFDAVNSIFSNPLVVICPNSTLAAPLEFTVTPSSIPNPGIPPPKSAATVTFPISFSFDSQPPSYSLNNEVIIDFAAQDTYRICSSEDSIEIAKAKAETRSRFVANRQGEVKQTLNDIKVTWDSVLKEH